MQGRGVVHAVVDHRNLAAIPLWFGDRGRFVLGTDACKYEIDPQISTDLVGHRLGVSGDHHDLDVKVVERVDRFPGSGRASPASFNASITYPNEEGLEPDAQFASGQRDRISDDAVFWDMPSIPRDGQRLATGKRQRRLTQLTREI